MLFRLPINAHSMLTQQRSFTYSGFLEFVDQLVKEGRTSGPNQDAHLIDFTDLNYKRMLRISKTLKLGPDLMNAAKDLRHDQYWVLITEAWCGDSAQTLPVVAGLVESSEGKITLDIILRDENPEWISKYHTNGSKSIPKLIAFDQSGNELFTWGPRPAPAQAMFTKWKQHPEGATKHDFEVQLHTWYSQDRTETTQAELATCLIASSLVNL